MGEVRVSTLLAGLALFIVLGGTATAASKLINGKSIKPGTITAKQIKNKSITAGKLKPSAIESLRGQKGDPGAKGATGATGIAGPAGIAGATGLTGPAGENGIVTPIQGEAADATIAADSFTELVKMTPPAGTYLITAKTVATSLGAGNTIECTIWVDGDDVADASAVELDHNRTASLAMMAVSPVDDSIALRCNPDSYDTFIRNIKLIALPVQG